MGSGALAAKVGSRLAHAAMPMVMPSSAMIASALGAHVVGPAGMGGAGAATAGAGIGNAAAGAIISLLDMIPIITTGAIATGSFDVMLGPGQVAVFAPSLPQPCAPHLAQPIAMGSPTVLVHGMQLVRVGDKTTCGAMVCDGVKSVVIGGGSTPAASVSMGDLVGSMSAVAMGAILTKTGAVEMVGEFGAALATASDKALATVDKVLDTGTKALDKTIDAATNAVDKVSGAAGAALGKVGEMVGSVGGALESILGGASLTGQTK